MYSNENAIGMFDKMVELGDYYSSGRVVYVYPEIIINDICSKVPVQKNDVILDVGCGTGLVTIPLAQKCKHVYAVDASEKVLMSLKLNCKKEKITNVEFHRVIVPDLPFDDCFFDKVIMVHPNKAYFFKVIGCE